MKYISLINRIRISRKLNFISTCLYDWLFHHDATTKRRTRESVFLHEKHFGSWSSKISIKTVDTDDRWWLLLVDYFTSLIWMNFSIEFGTGMHEWWPLLCVRTWDEDASSFTCGSHLPGPAKPGVTFFQSKKLIFNKRGKIRVFRKVCLV